MLLDRAINELYTVIPHTPKRLPIFWMHFVGKCAERLPIASDMCFWSYDFELSFVVVVLLCTFVVSWVYGVVCFTERG